LIRDKCSDETYELFQFCVEGAPDRSERLVDVVLLHGLTGHFMKTWGGSVVRSVNKNEEQAKPERETGDHSRTSDSEEGVVTDCWVRNLAIEKLSMATFWTLGYPAPLFEKQLGKEPSSLGEDSRKILQVLVRAGLGTRRGLLSGAGRHRPGQAGTTDRCSQLQTLSVER